MNTFEKGKVRTLIYQDNVDGIWYGTALEFNLTIDGDDRNTVFLELNRAISEYIRSAREVGDLSILNQEPDPDLVALWQSHVSGKKEITSPYTPYIAATESLVHGE